MKFQFIRFTMTAFALSLMIFAVILHSPSSHAETNAAKEKSAESASDKTIDFEADELLKAMSATLESAKSFSFKAHVNFDDVLESGQKIQYGGDIKIKVKRPNKIVASFDGDLVERNLWLDNDTLTILNKDNNFYGQLAVPSTIDETVDFILDNYDFTIPLADLVYSNPYESISENIQTGVVVGDGKVEGNDCVHLAFEQEYIDWQIWINESDRHLPCKLVINYKSIEGGPQYNAEFSDWKLNDKIEDSVFKALIPEEALKIEFIKMKRVEGDKK
jgi:hypothetical protein